MTPGSRPATIVIVGSSEPITDSPGRVWRAVDGEPSYLSCWLLGVGERAPEHGPDTSVWTGDQIDALQPAGDPARAGALLAVGQEPAPGHEDEFNAWMDEEHVPGLGGVPGTLCAHRYRSESCEPAYYAVYHLRDLDVPASPQWRAASRTERSAAMRPHARKRIRGLYVPA